MRLGIGMRKFWMAALTQVLLSAALFWGPDGLGSEIIWAMIGCLGIYAGGNVGERITEVLRTRAGGGGMHNGEVEQT